MTADNKPKFNPIDPLLAADIEDLPFLNTSLPFQFSDGSVIRYIDTCCACCGAHLAPDTLKGGFELIADGTTACLKAYGICYSCRTITPLDAKLNIDGTALFKGPNGWSKRSWAEKRPAGFGRALVGLVQKKWQQLLPPILVFVAISLWLLLKS